MRPIIHPLIILSSVFLSIVSPALSDVPYSQYILAPSTRVLKPASVNKVQGSVQNANSLITSSGSASFTGINSSATYDFGKNIAGRVSFIVDTLSDSEIHSIGVTFTESSLYISSDHCDATQDAGIDAPLWFNVSSPGPCSAPRERQRGGFRYLTLVHDSEGSVQISNLTVFFTAEPAMTNPAEYTGYFSSDSEKLNRVWYAGAYTNQLCIIDPTTGDSLQEPTDFWYYNTTIANGTSVLVDGAKRDRLVWPGDIAVSGPSIYVSTANYEATRNGLSSLLELQNDKGQLPYSGNPFQAYINKLSGTFVWSFTYHLYTLIDIYDYYMFTGDQDYVETYWAKYKLAMAYSLSTVDSSGLANVTVPYDWLRSGMGGYNIEANSIFYYTLGTGLSLAAAIGDNSVVANWTTTRALMQTAANSLLWDSSANLFRDNETTSLHPQDGNSWAVASGLVSDPTRASAISAALASRWIRPYGAPAPEAGKTISPFASGFELRAHYAAGHAERGVLLMEFMWADFMLDDPRMTNSTFIEGYSTNGSLHYAPYSNDPRVSHAHGWATAPTAVLTNSAVGIHLTGPAGKTWLMKPQLGGLGTATAGYSTNLGTFSASWVDMGELGLNGTFETPAGTTGSIQLPQPSSPDITKLVLGGPQGQITQSCQTGSGGFVTIDGLTGGQYIVSFS